MLSGNKVKPRWARELSASEYTRWDLAGTLPGAAAQERCVRGPQDRGWEKMLGKDALATAEFAIPPRGCLPGRPPPLLLLSARARDELGCQKMRCLIWYQTESFGLALPLGFSLWYWERPCCICEGFHFTEDTRTALDSGDLKSSVSGWLIAHCFP